MTAIDPNETFDQIVFGVLFATSGLLIVFGAHRRWAWLVDPRESLWFCYTQSFWKLALGRTGLLVLTYAQGAVVSLFGLYLVVEAAV